MENDGEDEEEQDSPKENKEVKLDMVPKVDSLIEYQEVMESTPEDATPEDAANIDNNEQH